MSTDGVPMILESPDRELEDFNDDVVHELAILGYLPHSVGLEITATHEGILVDGINNNKAPYTVAAEMHTAMLDHAVAYEHMHRSLPNTEPDNV